MSSIEVVDVNNETKTEEAPVNNEVVEQNETVNEEPDLSNILLWIDWEHLGFCPFTIFRM